MRVRVFAIIAMSIAGARCGARSPCSGLPATTASSAAEPGGTKAWAACAQNDPDEYAWRLFFYLNQQADAKTRGLPDRSRAGFGDAQDDTPVVWETWALSSGKYGEVFRPGEGDPGEWSGLPPVGPKILFHGFKSDLPDRDGVAPDGRDNPLFPAEESRMNRSTFDTIHQGKLYNIALYQAAVQKARSQLRASVVTFEPQSKEIKARWVHLCDQKDEATPPCVELKKRYYWRRVQRLTQFEVMGLGALHVISKDLPNWVWMDFGHVDCEHVAGEKPANCREAGPSDLPLRDSTTASTHGIRRETVGTKWEYYRLRGTQIDFNSPSLLWNPILEKNMPRGKSCITCHFYASVDDAAVPIETIGGIGVPESSALYDCDVKDLSLRCPDGKVGQEFRKLMHFQTDFVWAIKEHAK